MKLHWISIFILFLISCQSNQIKEVDNLKKRNQVIDSKEIVKEYEVNFKINTTLSTVQFYKATEVIYFGFYQKNGFKYFYPKFLLISARSSNYSFNNFRKLTIEKHSKNEIEFELELCSRIVTTKSIEKEKEGFISEFEVKKKIKEIVEKDLLDAVSILSENYSKNRKAENIVCRKFRFKKVGSKMIVEKGEFINKINPKDLIKYGELEIIESGNILDTLNFE